MSRTIRILIALVVIIVIVAAGAFLYLTRPAPQASQDVQSNTQQLQPGPSGDAQVYRISQDGSQATFTINEVLNGADNTVVGATSEVAGDIKVDLTNPSASEVGQIRVNARTLKTDSSRRDGMISRFVLSSAQDANEFIDFQPTAISGLPASASIGDTVNFQITGDMTIAGTTKPVTFDASVTLTSADQITGSAQATVTRANFGLTIPSVPQVASVEDNVILAINFVANRVTQSG